MAGFDGWFEGFGDDVQIVAGGLCMLNGLLGSSGCVSGSSISSRTTPGSLPGGEDAVDHVDPVEERVDDEHDRVEPDFEAAEFCAEVDHEDPVEA